MKAVLRHIRFTANALRWAMLTLVVLFTILSAWGQESNIKTLPYHYGFENGDPGAEGWTVVSNGNYVSISSPSHNGNNGFYFKKNTLNESSYLISPELDSNNHEIAVSFYTKYLKDLNETDPGFFQVGYSKTTTDIAEFTWFEGVFPDSSSWELHNIEAPVGTKYVAIKVTLTKTGDHCFYFDDFSFVISACLPPANLTWTDITYQNATLAWDAPETTETITGYAYQYKKVSENTWSAETTTAETTVIINSLSANTNYDFRVRALYGNLSSEYESITILTDCNESVTLPFFEEFENELGCWRIRNGNEDSHIYHFPGSASGGVFQFVYHNLLQYLITPQIDSNSEIKVSFNYAYDFDNDNAFRVGYSSKSDNLSDFTWGEYINAEQGDNLGLPYYEQHFPKGTKYVAVEYNAGSYEYNSLMIDNFSIIEAGTLPPDELSVSDVTDEDATITWTVPATDLTVSSYAYQLKKSVDPWGSDKMVSATTNSITFNDLEADTDYDFRIKAIYGNNESLYASISFSTYTGLPYEYGFENGLGHWIMLHKHNDTGVNPVARHNGEKGFVFYSHSTDEQYLITPLLKASTSDKIVSFYYKDIKPDSEYAETFYVGYSTTSNDISAFTWDASATVAQCIPWTLYEKTFPAATKYIAIKYMPRCLGLLIDDFSLAENSAFAKPTDLSLQSLSETEAKLIWAVPEGATAFVYQHKKSSEAAWSDEATIRTNNVTLTNLTANTIYSFRVKAIYSGNNASNYATIDFLTDAETVSLPYSDGFENGMGGWRMEDCTPSTGIMNTQDAHNGTHDFHFDIADHHQYLISPRFIGRTSMKVSFYYKNLVGFKAAAFQVGYSNSKASTITWGDVVTTSNGEWKLYETIVPAETQYITICSLKEGSYFYLDDFTVSEATEFTLTAHQATLNGVSKYWTTFYHETENYLLPNGAMVLTMDNENHLFVVGDGNIIPKGTAVIIMADTSALDASDKITLIPTAVTATPVSGNVLQGTSSATAASTVAGGKKVYVLSKVGDDFGFFEYTGEIPGNKAYYNE